MSSYPVGKRKGLSVRSYGVSPLFPSQITDDRFTHRPKPIVIWRASPLPDSTRSVLVNDKSVNHYAHRYEESRSD